MQEQMNLSDDEREAERADALRREAYDSLCAGRARVMSDLDLRAAAQHAQTRGDWTRERQADYELERRGQS